MYVYKCPKCGYQTEEYLLIHRTSPRLKCPDCETGKLKRVDKPYKTGIHGRFAEDLL